MVDCKDCIYMKDQEYDQECNEFKDHTISSSGICSKFIKKICLNCTHDEVHSGYDCSFISCGSSRKDWEFSLDFRKYCENCSNYNDKYNSSNECCRKWVYCSNHSEFKPKTCNDCERFNEEYQICKIEYKEACNMDTKCLDFKLKNKNEIEIKEIKLKNEILKKKFGIINGSEKKVDETLKEIEKRIEKEKADRHELLLDAFSNDKTWYKRRHYFTGYFAEYWKVFELQFVYFLDLKRKQERTMKKLRYYSPHFYLKTLFWRKKIKTLPKKEWDKIEKVLKIIVENKKDYEEYSERKEIKERKKELCRLTECYVDKKKTTRKKVALKVCESCGKEILIEAIFCSSCGRRF